MYRTPAISTLLILTLCIVGKVLSAPREKMIRQMSEQEQLLLTREAELLELTRAARDERSHESREDEVKHHLTRSIKEPLPIEKREDKADATKKPTTIDIPKNSSPSIPESSEAKDMTESQANPKDDDDSTTVTSSSNVPVTTEKNSSAVNQSANKTSSGSSVKPDKDIPDNKPTLNVTSETNSDATANQTSEPGEQSPNHSTTTPSTVSPPVSAVTSEQSVTSPTTSKKPTDATTASSTTTATTTTTATEKSTMKTPATTITNAPIAATTTTTIKPEKPTSMTTSISTKSEPITNNSMTTSSMETTTSEAERKLHEKKPTSMPSGIVALITAIAFAIVAVMAYVGLVVWRRYLEWRYGNRELLVNEFDSNDIGNFEL